MNQDQLSSVISECVQAQDIINKSQIKLSDTESKITSILDDFVRSKIVGYNSFNQYYTIYWSKKKFVVSTYYDYDSTLATRQVYSYEELKKFHKMEQFKTQAYDELREIRDEDELRALYSVLEKKFKREVYHDFDY